MGERDTIEIEALLALGENATAEFKSSLRCDLATGKVNRDLSKVVAKTLAGFLNKSGGILLIGVADDGRVLGIDQDMATLPRRDTDGFEQHLRLLLGKYLGVEVTPSIDVEFAQMNDLTVACVRCAGWHEPVFLQDGDKQEFYVRDGNLTRPYGIKESHAYIREHWRDERRLSALDVQDIIAAARIVAESGVPSAGSGGTDPAPTQPGRPTSSDVDPRGTEGVAVPGIKPIEDSDEIALETSLVRDLRVHAQSSTPWLQVATRRVLNLFLRQLYSSNGWKRIYIISPWISEISDGASLSFELLIRRIQADRTTVYLVTRPPEDVWHELAIQRFAATRRANIAFVPELHAKLYTAQTNQGEFALLGSANFTQKSLSNREIGVMVNGYREGRSVVRDLNYEASQIYRMSGRRLVHKADFAAT